jgi:hypothetical protein
MDIFLIAQAETGSVTEFAHLKWNYGSAFVNHADRPRKVWHIISSTEMTVAVETVVRRVIPEKPNCVARRIFSVQNRILAKALVGFIEAPDFATREMTAGAGKATFVYEQMLGSAFRTRRANNITDILIEVSC